MSRAPRRGRPRPTHRDADWSEVNVTSDDHGVTYRVLWSAERWMYLGVCDAHPTLSWQAQTADAALDGICRRVHEHRSP